MARTERFSRAMSAYSLSARRLEPPAAEFRPAECLHDRRRLGRAREFGEEAAIMRRGLVPGATRVGGLAAQRESRGTEIGRQGLPEKRLDARAGWGDLPALEIHLRQAQPRVPAERRRPRPRRDQLEAAAGLRHLPGVALDLAGQQQHEGAGGGLEGPSQDLLLERTRLVRPRSEEHTSELQSLAYLVCRLL